jgi:flagellar biogenesis protein FliO
MTKRYFFFFFALLSFSSLLVRAEDPQDGVPKDQGNSFNIQHYLQEEPTIENKNSSNFMSEFVNMLMTLLLVVVVLLIISWFVKRMLQVRTQQENSSSSIKVVERRMLNPKVAIYLLDVMGQGIVIAEFPNGITRLAEFPLNLETAVEDDELTQSQLSVE